MREIYARLMLKQFKEMGINVYRQDLTIKRGLIISPITLQNILFSLEYTIKDGQHPDW